jgi:hypothetical protein
MERWTLLLVFIAEEVLIGSPLRFATPSADAVVEVEERNSNHLEYSLKTILSFRTKIGMKGDDELLLPPFFYK